jgi:osmotically-inducible protein OsmY
MQRTSWIWASLFTVVVGVGLANNQTPALAMNVETWAGVVPCFGIAPSQETRVAAEAEAHKVHGVKRVENELQVGANVQQTAQVRDEELERSVKEAFDTPAFKDITVDVKNGVVQLTGTVPSWAWRLEAVAAAYAIPGVRAVEDYLRLMFAV